MTNYCTTLAINDACMVHRRQLLQWTLSIVQQRMQLTMHSLVLGPAYYNDTIIAIVRKVETIIT